ncbi:MAG: iron complex transport system substrate-binding protein [Verrucomicrobiales bacterium]|jgi:iron complex transport system substrate-binding protein
MTSMQSHRRIFIALITALALFAAACGEDTDATVTANSVAADESPETTAPVVEQDAMEESLNIVSLSPTATEMLFAIGAGDLVVAVDNFSNFPADAPITDLSGFDPNVEAIAGFEPTLVVSQGPIEGLDILGIENLVLPAAASFDDVYAQIEQLGATTGHVGDAAELVGQMQADIDAVLDSLPMRETPLTFYHELDNTFFTVTSSTFIGEVYKLLGLENAADAADPDGAAFGYPQLNEEFLVTADPDIIFLADTKCCGQNAAEVAARPGWDLLSAVTSGNIVELDDDVASRWGPRLVEFIQVVGTAVSAIEAVPAS